MQVILTANEAKTQFGEMLLKVQKSPVHINKNGKPVAVVLSVEDYQELEKAKLQFIQSRFYKAQDELKKNQLTDGAEFVNKLIDELQ